MPKAPHMLIITTSVDHSAPLFLEKAAQELIKSQIIQYDEDMVTVFQYDFSYLYFRDPFNDVGLSAKIVEPATKRILKTYPKAYSVDGISSFEDLLFEDKWNQYKLFSELMPHTELLNSINQVDFKTQFVKKRITSRSRGVVFERSAFPNDAKADVYLAQNKVDIEQEYRVYVVGGKIIVPIATKSHKTPQQIVKITGIKEIVDPEIKKICEAVYEKTKYDLLGLDIAKTKEGFLLLEVNRSCQFKSYQKFSQINSARILNSHLLKH